MAKKKAEKEYVVVTINCKVPCASGMKYKDDTFTIDEVLRPDLVNALIAVGKIKEVAKNPEKDAAQEKLKEATDKHAEASQKLKDAKLRCTEADKHAKASKTNSDKVSKDKKASDKDKSDSKQISLSADQEAVTAKNVFTEVETIAKDLKAEVDKAAADLKKIK